MIVFDEIDEVIDILITKISSDKILILIKNRLQANKINRRKGTVTKDEFLAIKNEITNDLLEMIDEW